MLRRHSCYRALALTLALALSDFLAGAVAAADVPPLVSGDESIVVTAHQIKYPKGILKYEARAGRLPIRNDESGEIRGYLFFVAYVEKTAGAPRPLPWVQASAGRRGWRRIFPAASRIVVMKADT
jgi:hypothetical protein